MKENYNVFIKKVIIATAIVFLFAIILLLFKAAFSVLLLVLAGVLIAIYFRGVATWLKNKTKLPEWLALLISVIGTFLIIAGISWLIGNTVSNQFGQIKQQLPDMLNSIKEKLSHYRWGRQLINRYLSGGDVVTVNKQMLTRIKGFFTTTFGVLGNLYIILFLAVFFTVDPKLYKRGIISLIPPKGRKKGEEVLNNLGHTLRNWLIGKIFAMFVVAILTLISMLIMGMPAPLVLALTAGLLNFIPNFGPVIAMIPAVLIGLTIGPQTAWIVAVIYCVIQVLESNFITPLAQQHLIKMPPALIIFAQVVIAVFTGFIGIVLATPIVAILMVLVQNLYVNEMDKKA